MMTSYELFYLPPTTIAHDPAATRFSPWFELGMGASLSIVAALVAVFA